MRYESENGRRPIGGTSDGARVGGRRTPPRSKSVQQRAARGDRRLGYVLMVAGYMLFLVCMMRTRIPSEFGLGIAGAGFLGGMGLGCLMGGMDR